MNILENPKLETNLEAYMCDDATSRRAYVFHSGN